MTFTPSFRPARRLALAAACGAGVTLATFASVALRAADAPAP